RAHKCGMSRHDNPAGTIDSGGNGRDDRVESPDSEKRVKSNRRTFLKGSAAAALGAGALSSVGAERAAAWDDERERIDRVDTASSTDGMVAASDPRAVTAGTDVLEAGGNAVDAAVAVQFALNVVQPHTSGVGGGGFMLVYDAGEDELYSIDNRERAPFGATPDMFLGDDDEPIPF